ncbi:MAG: hypothetical protein OIF51_04260, partial [Cellvibrionaceae bacterium]|nr:hypothetical protein [Cellvibrionaceae bacterium]
MEDWQRDYLKEEYFKLQDQYEQYDNRALQIKGWIAAGAIAGIAIGFEDGKSADGMLWVIIAVLSACFWYLETKWKQFQYALGDRIQVLEAYFRGDQEIIIKDPEPLQIYNWWFKSYANDEPIYPYEREFRPRKKLVRLWVAGMQPFVMLPYSLIIAVCIVLLFLNIG